MQFWSKLKSRFYSKGGSSQTAHVELQKLIGYQFKNIDLLELSLTHRSYVRSNPKSLPSNERLEFLGDSVLGLAIASQLFLDNPHQREGNLTKIKAMLVNEMTLAQVACEIGLNNFILLSPEEDRTGGRERASIVSDAFESIIGAIYLDGGFAIASEVVLRLIYSRREAIISDANQRNYKGELLELAQSYGAGMPRYDVLSEAGPDHEKIFTVNVTVENMPIGEGVGQSKKEAEQKAAAEGLKNYKKYFDSNPE